MPYKFKSYVTDWHHQPRLPIKHVPKLQRERERVKILEKKGDFLVCVCVCVCDKYGRIVSGRKFTEFQEKF